MCDSTGRGVRGAYPPGDFPRKWFSLASYASKRVKRGYVVAVQARRGALIPRCRFVETLLSPWILAEIGRALQFCLSAVPDRLIDAAALHTTERSDAHHANATDWIAMTKTEKPSKTLALQTRPFLRLSRQSRTGAKRNQFLSRLRAGLLFHFTFSVLLFWCFPPGEVTRSAIVHCVRSAGRSGRRRGLPGIRGTGSKGRTAYPERVILDPTRNASDRPPPSLAELLQMLSFQSCFALCKI